MSEWEYDEAPSEPEPPSRTPVEERQRVVLHVDVTIIIVKDPDGGLTARAAWWPPNDELVAEAADRVRRHVLKLSEQYSDHWSFITAVRDYARRLGARITFSEDDEKMQVTIVPERTEYFFKRVFEE